jgi:hypothetical protein
MANPAHGQLEGFQGKQPWIAGVVHVRCKRERHATTVQPERPDAYL